MDNEIPRFTDCLQGIRRDGRCAAVALKSRRIYVNQSLPLPSKRYSPSTLQTWITIGYHFRGGASFTSVLFELRSRMLSVILFRSFSSIDESMLHLFTKFVKCGKSKFSQIYNGYLVIIVRGLMLWIINLQAFNFQSDATLGKLCVHIIL